jgi:hypothetical protein
MESSDTQANQLVALGELPPNYRILWSGMFLYCPLVLFATAVTDNYGYVLATPDFQIEGNTSLSPELSAEDKVKALIALVESRYLATVMLIRNNLGETLQ